MALQPCGIDYGELTSNSLPRTSLQQQQQQQQPETRGEHVVKIRLTGEN